MKAPAFDYQRARTADDAWRALAAQRDDAKLVAGSQSLGPLLNLRLANPGVLVDVRGIESLRAAREEPDAIFLGAGLTHAMFEDRKVPDPTNGFMHRVAADIAYRAVRNRGTFGGSLCHADPAADWVNVCAALDGTALAASERGEREIALEGFVTGIFETALAPDELLLGVRVRRYDARARFGYWKFCRKPGEFSEATGVVLVDPSRAVKRVVIGALDRAPLRIDDAAAIVDRFDAQAIERALDAAGLDDAYDRQLHRVALKRAIEGLA